VLKYTLGAIAGAIVILVAGFAIIAVTIGDSEADPAQLVIVSILADGNRVPGEFDTEVGQIVDLRFHNQSDVLRSARISSDGAEQLPEAPTGDHAAPRPSVGVYFEVPAGQGESRLIRFTRPGDYILALGYGPGVYFPPQEIVVHVR